MESKQPSTCKAFWKDIFETYSFEHWFERYQERQNWSRLFNGNSPAYYELPIAMQAGIWMQYELEKHSGCTDEREFKRLVVEYVMGEKAVPPVPVIEYEPTILFP